MTIAGQWPAHDLVDVGTKIGAMVRSRLCGGMIDYSGLVHGTAVGHQSIRNIDLGDCWSIQHDGRLLQKKYFFIFGPAVGVLLILSGVIVQTFAKLTTAAAMYDGVIPVDTKRPCNIVPVRVEIGDNDSLAEGRGHKGRQQKKGCALS